MMGEKRRGTRTRNQSTKTSSDANGSKRQAEQSGGTVTVESVPVTEPTVSVEASPAGSVGEARSVACAGQPDQKWEEVAISRITIPPEHRELDEQQVDALVESIRQMGLLQPVGVTPDHRLIYGRHRLAAYRKLGYTEIPATIHEYDNPLLVELAGIDENLQRKALTELEESQALARRKQIFEQLHPETRLGKSQAAGCNRARGKHVSDKLSLTFAEDTAAKTGRSRRTVERKVKIGQNLDPQAAETLKGTPVEDNQSELEALSELPAEEQREAAAKIKAGEIEGVREVQPGTVRADVVEQGARALETLAAVLEKLGLYQDCEGSILQITNALADHATSTTDDSDQSGAQEPGDREPVGQEPAQDGAEAPTAGEPSADVDAAEQPTCPTTNNPTLVTIRGEDFELARTRGMWHFRRPPERGWTNCDAEMVRLIEEQLSVRHAGAARSEAEDSRTHLGHGHAIAPGGSAASPVDREGRGTSGRLLPGPQQGGYGIASQNVARKTP